MGLHQINSARAVGKPVPGPHVNPRHNARTIKRNQYRTRTNVGNSNNNVDDMSVGNLPPSYCDDFSCTSSPAVELTVKALAKDIERGNGVWTTSLLSRDVEYKDRYCSTKGIDQFKADFVPTFCKATSVKIIKMYMLDAPPSRQAAIEYELEGLLDPNSKSPTPVTVAMTTTVTLNLLTGQIEKREDSWNVRSLLSKAPFNAARLAWAGVQKSREARKKGSELIEKSVSSVLGSMDEGDQFVPDPTDPTKFFQGGDNFKDDAINFVLFLAVAWVVVQGYSTLLGGGSGGGSGFGGGAF